MQIFETQVKPRLGDGKVAYVWVDALRFEMARELADVLKADFDLTLSPALGTVPTITEIGMAALLPRADRAAKVVPVGLGKLGLQIDRTVIKDRKDRIAFLKAHAGVPVFDAKLDDLLPKPSKKVRDGIQGAELVLITSQEIDELCEADNITQARRQMDGVLSDLRRGFRVLADLGIKTIVLAADHGHLFGEEIGEDMKIEAPGGETADLHRRVWVGVGGTSEPSYLRTSLSVARRRERPRSRDALDVRLLQVEGRGQGLLPRRAVAAGADHPRRGDDADGPGARRAADRHQVDADARGRRSSRPGSSRSRSAGQSTGLFGLEPPKVRVEVRAKGKCVSTPVSASYGFEEATGDVQLRASADDPKQIEPEHRDPDGRGRGDRAEDGGRQPPRRHQRGGTGQPG